MNQSNSEFLLNWGWDDFFSQQVLDNKLTIGRVIGEEKGRWRVQISQAETVWAQLPGKYRFQTHLRKDLPSVGDWILCKYEISQSITLVQKVLERKSCLARKDPGLMDSQILASNVDYVFIMTSANGDFNIARLERYMSLAWSSGAQPVILVTKADLAENFDDMMAELSHSFPGVDAIAISVQGRINLEALERFLQPGKSLVFVGSSGVGKSTLTNYLLGREVLATQGIRESDDRGKHTTTARYLFPLANGAFVIDTPGMRSLSVMDQEAGVENQFSDLAELELRCRFSDCEHRTEPGCAVLSALEADKLDEDRWRRYQKLQREFSRKERKQSRTLGKNKSR